MSPNSIAVSTFHLTDSSFSSIKASKEARFTYDYENDDFLKALDGCGVKYILKTSMRKSATTTLHNLGRAITTKTDVNEKVQARALSLEVKDSCFDVEDDVEFWQYKPSNGALAKSCKVEPESPTMDIITKIGSQTSVYLVLKTISRIIFIFNALFIHRCNSSTLLRTACTVATCKSCRATLSFWNVSGRVKTWESWWTS